MTTTREQQSTASVPPASAPAPGEAGEQLYTMSRDGRRQAIVLLFGVASIWVFALWTFITILQDGIGGVEWVSLVLMLGMLLVAPVVAWSLLEEAYSSISVGQGGLTYRSLGGITAQYRWSDIEGTRPRVGRGRLARLLLGSSDGEAASEGGRAASEDQTEAQPERESAGVGEDEPETVLLRVRQGRARAGKGSLAGALHGLAHGGDLPVYGGLENREALLAEIYRRIGG